MGPGHVLDYRAPKSHQCRLPDHPIPFHISFHFTPIPSHPTQSADASLISSPESEKWKIAIPQAYALGPMPPPTPPSLAMLNLAQRPKNTTVSVAAR